MRSSRALIGAAVIAVVAPANYALAQSPINAPGAMQPSTGTGVWHFMPLYREFGSDPTSNVTEGREIILLNQIAYGVTSRFSVQLDVPVIRSEAKRAGASDEQDFGVGDLTLLGKYRIYQHDSGPTNTTRFSVIGGLQIPGTVDSEMDSSGDAWDPIVGGVFSTVQGRHGFNAGALWEFYTGDEEDQADSLRYDASYLFRLSPETYSAETEGALYAVAELNGFYGANGDDEIFLSPGLMYETSNITLDATVMIPVYQDLDHRAETDLLFGLGFRLSF